MEGGDVEYAAHVGVEGEMRCCGCILEKMYIMCIKGKFRGCSIMRSMSY